MPVKDTFVKNTNGQLIGGGDSPSDASVDSGMTGYQDLDAPIRRESLGVVEKPAITVWDAGWNMSNAIQVNCFFRISYFG